MATPASRGETKKRFQRYIEVILPGKDNAAARSLARSIVVFAQAVKHAKTPSRREAGIIADSVIILANLPRRLDPRDLATPGLRLSYRVSGSL